jgi:hypothetical protein
MQQINNLTLQGHRCPLSYSNNVPLVYYECRDPGLSLLRKTQRHRDVSPQSRLTISRLSPRSQSVSASDDEQSFDHAQSSLRHAASQPACSDLLWAGTCSRMPLCMLLFDMSLGSSCLAARSKSEHCVHNAIDKSETAMKDRHVMCRNRFLVPVPVDFYAACTASSCSSSAHTGACVWWRVMCVNNCYYMCLHGHSTSQSILNRKFPS